jgi:hypothetical protein
MGILRSAGLRRLSSARARSAERPPGPPPSKSRSKSIPKSAEAPHNHRRALDVRSTAAKTQGHETVSIEPWGPDGVRVRATLGRGNIGEPPIGALLPLADALKCARPARRVIVDEAGVQSLPPPATSVISGALNATISSAGQLIFTRTDTGAELLREHYPLHGKPGREYSALARGTGGRLMRVAQSFTSPRNETIYGLGQQLNGMLDQKGVGVELDQFNTQVRHPFDTHAAVQPACP